MSPCFTSRLASLIISLLVVVHQIAAAADDFVCQRSSENDSGTYLDLIVANAYCLDSDSLPASVFAPSELNTAGRFNANGGSPVCSRMEWNGINAHGRKHTDSFVVWKVKMLTI